jgi:hypothetical protein
VPKRSKTDTTQEDQNSDEDDSDNDDNDNNKPKKAPVKGRGRGKAPVRGKKIRCVTLPSPPLLLLTIPLFHRKTAAQRAAEDEVENAKGTPTHLKP